MADVDYHLRRQVAELNGLVTWLGEQVALVSGQVSAVDAKQQQTNDALRQLNADFLAFVRRTELTANIQRAETRVGVLQDQLDHDYGHHKTVRRTAVGMLQAFDVGLVSQDTVHSVSEQLMIQTPRYWLAPTLVGLAAWAADDPGLCDRAVEEAFRRSPQRTSLFFALVLRRQDRPEMAVRWLRHYLDGQDPARLGREFAVILESIAQGAFGAPGRALLGERLEKWQRVLLADEEARQAQVRRWRIEIESLRGPGAAHEFPRLARVSPQWPQLDAALRDARVQQAVLDKYTALLEREATPSDRLEDAVDDILDRLVRECDTEELPVRRDLAFNQAVIHHDGDLDAARRAAEADAAALEETLDYLTVQTTAALTPETIGTSSATQRLAVAACREWFGQAHQAFTRDYRLAVPREVWVTTDAIQTCAAHTFSLPPWSGALSAPMPELEAQLSAHWDHHVQAYLAQLPYPWRSRLYAMSAVVVVLLLLPVATPLPALFGLVAALAVGGAWGLGIYAAHRGSMRALRAARELLASAKEEALRELRGARAEFTDWHSAFESANGAEPRTREMIRSLATAGGSVSPFEGRVVTPPGGGDTE
jgi:hypothetical protein